MKTRFDVKKCGAIGDGITDDGWAIRAAFWEAIGANGEVFFPPGTYLIRGAISFANISSRISVNGCGQNVSVILAEGCGGLSLGFNQSGMQQPWGVTIRGLGLRARGQCKEAIHISYGNPDATNDHSQPSCSISNVQVVSDADGCWANGIEIVGAWNPTLDNVFISGDAANGVWNNMRGAGISLIGMCVNAHLSNVRCNFWAVGLLAEGTDRNTEGIFCSNCSMVAVRRGVWIIGNPAVHHAPRISTLTWVGGLIECRVGGVTGGSAAFHLQHVWTALITGCQMITETISGAVEITYGLCIQNCKGVVVSCCDVNAFIKGVYADNSDAVNANGLTFTNTGLQIEFADGVARSRSFGHTLVNNFADSVDKTGQNKMGFV